MKNELAVMIWNEFISQSLNDGCKLSFKDLENRIGEKINELTCNAYNDSIDELLELQGNNRNNLKL